MNAAQEKPLPELATEPGTSNVPVTPERVLVRPSREIGGQDGPEPTRYGDWEKAGRCIDF
jgi:hypothetical protein